MDIDEVVIFDISGKDIFRKYLKTNRNIQINIPKGIYFIYLKGKNFNRVERLIISK